MNSETKAGQFFAIDRRAWAVACGLSINAAVSYLVLGRGTGRDQRTTSWSVNGVESHTGISRPRAIAAIKSLVKAGVVRTLQAGKHPRYFLVPADEVPQSEAYPRPPLDQNERIILNELVGGPRKFRGLGQLQVAERLVDKRYAAAHGDAGYRRVDFDSEAAAKPDWIWLPNTLIDGVPGNLAAPVELVRQTQNRSAMRLFIDLYHAHSLAPDGGIHWRTIRTNTERHKVGARGAFTVYGFRHTGRSTWWERACVTPHMTGRTEKYGDDVRDTGWAAVWDAWALLLRLGLVEYVYHVVEADTDQAELLHPYAVDTGEEDERSLAKAAHRAGELMLTDAQRDWARSEGLHLVPVRQHMTEVQMVGIARLRYRPWTSATTVWFSRMAEWRDKAAEFHGLADEILSARADLQYQGKSREINGDKRASTQL